MTEIELPTASFIEKFKQTEGALSVCESIAIFNLAKQSPKGQYLELGVFKGKSAMSALLGLPSGGHFDLVEPEFENDDFLDEALDAIEWDDYGIHVHPIVGYSTDIIDEYDNLCYVMVDSGSHQDGLPLKEVKLLEDRMVQGGIIVFHDWDSQFVEVKQASDYLVSTGKYEYIPIPWHLIVKHVQENNLEKGNKSWHHPELHKILMMFHVQIE